MRGSGKMDWVVCCLLLSGIGLCNCGEDDNAPEPIVIGTTAVDIDTRTITTHVGEAAIGTFLSGLFMSEIEERGKEVDVVVVNAGAIRGGAYDPDKGSFVGEDARKGKIYPAGELTDVDVDGWLPFQNSTDIITVTGTQLKSVLERSVASLPPDLRGDQGGWLLQASGLAYTVDCDGTAQQLNSGMTAITTPGTRITRIVVGDDVVYDTGASIDDLAGLTLKLATFSFITQGFDGHIAFTEVPTEQRETIPFEELNLVEEVKNHVEDNSPISPQKTGRITIVGECGQPGTQP